MFFDPKAQAERKAAQEAFEAKKIADLTVAEFRKLMAQIAWDADTARRERSNSFMAACPSLEQYEAQPNHLGGWGPLR